MTGTVDIILSIIWILMAPAILIYLGVSYWLGTRKISEGMDEDEDEFEEDLMTMYAPLDVAAEAEDEDE
jgi:hypothetical protein